MVCLRNAWFSMSVCVSCNGVFVIVLFKTLYEVKISRELKNSRISSSSTDTTRSSRDPYIVPFNFISQHRCAKKGHYEWSLYYLFLRAAFVQGLFPVGADFPFTCEFFGRQHLIKDIWYRIKKRKKLLRWWSAWSHSSLTEDYVLANKLLQNMLNAHSHLKD